jgi:hypothetical protein
MLLLATQAAGCVERRYVINSQPQGALVYLSTGEYLGATPVDGYFVYYGKYVFRLVRDGYEPLTVVQDIPAPWYELPGIDFISENLNPFKIRDVHTFCYTLQPAQAVRPDDVLNRGSELRVRGQGIGTPREPRPVAPEPAPGQPALPTLPAPTPVPPAAPPPGAAPPGAAPLGPPIPGMPPAVSSTSGRGPVNGP